jgi:hypothetical protein
VQSLPRPFVYALDFGFSHDFPLEYWREHYGVLAEYGYDTVMLWVSGCAPVEGFEATLEWRCDYVGELVGHIQSLGMKALLMSGLFNWMGMSPGFIRMDADLEARWPKELCNAWPLESQRRALCSSRAYAPAMEYLKKLWSVAPHADGFAIECGCEKTHCQCDRCTARGHWQIESDFLDEFSAWLWSQKPEAEIVWNYGYARTHGAPPESQLYTALAGRKDPRLLRWYTRGTASYEDSAGTHRFDDPATIARLGANGILHHPMKRTIEETASQAADCGLLGLTGHPDERYLFLPEQRPEDSGYERKGGPPAIPTSRHWLFRQRAFHYQHAHAHPHATAAHYTAAVAQAFTANDHRLAAALTRLEELLVQERLLQARSAQYLYLSQDGLAEEGAKIRLTPEDTSVMETLASSSLPAATTAGALLGMGH